jgi:hypothetical protein
MGKFKILEMIKQNEIKVLLMANVHGGKLHHPDTEVMKGKKGSFRCSEEVNDLLNIAVCGQKYCNM